MCRLFRFVRLCSSLTNASNVFLLHGKPLPLHGLVWQHVVLALFTYRAMHAVNIFNWVRACVCVRVCVSVCVCWTLVCVRERTTTTEKAEEKIVIGARCCSVNDYSTHTNSMSPMDTVGIEVGAHIVRRHSRWWLEWLVFLLEYHINAGSIRIQINKPKIHKTHRHTHTHECCHGHKSEMRGSARARMCVCVCAAAIGNKIWVVFCCCCFGRRRCYCCCCLLTILAFCSS